MRRIFDKYVELKYCKDKKFLITLKNCNRYSYYVLGRAGEPVEDFSY